MAVTVKEYAAQIGLSPARLVAMLAEADLADKTEDSEITNNEKRMLVMQLQKGRVHQVRQHSEHSVIQTQRKSGAAREIVVEIKGGHTLAPRPIVTPQPADQKNERADDESSVPESAVERQDVSAADQPDTEVTETVPADEIHAEAEVTSPPDRQSDVESQLQKVAEAEPVDEIKQEEPEVPTELPPPDDDRTPKRSKPKRKTVKRQQREQLHIVKGREKLQRDRERKKISQKLDDRISQHTFHTPSEKKVYSVSISDNNPIRQLAQTMSVKASDVIRYLLDEFNLQVTINGSVDRDAATLLVEGLGHKPVDEDQQDIETQLLGGESDARKQLPRPPVVAVMGHVDHGKTTLLDTIRSTKVAAMETGGITQHIGAYMVETSHGKITFLDTPGHEAFTAMRARGARATDIVILVVAADDGVKPQTVEAINHAKFANVPLIVAINKIDKADTDPNRVLRELTEHEVIAESLGGDVQVIEISALKNIGIDDLLEGIELLAGTMEPPLTAPVDGIASGVIIEARVDKGRGAVVTVLVQKGILTPKQIMVVGQQKGKIRQLTDYRGNVVKEARPSTPIEISGFPKVPEVGDEFVCPPDERSAQQLIDFRQSGEHSGTDGQASVTFGDLNDPKIVNVIIKTDVSGSAEALADAVKSLSDDRVDVKVIHAMVGSISQSDVNLAIAASAFILAFNVSAEATAKKLISANNLTVIHSRIIYDALDELKSAIHKKIGPNMVDTVIATANVLQVFKFSRLGTIAGCYVEDGTVKNNRPVRVVRDDAIVYNGLIDSLRRFQNDVSEVKSGLECGIQLKNYNDVQIDDRLEVYESREAD